MNTEVFLFSLFTAIIIFITVYSMIKVFHIAYTRKEITLVRCRIYSVISIVIGLGIASVLPFGYAILVDALLY